MRSGADAEAFLKEHRFVWHQRFELAPGIASPGENDILWLLERCSIPARLDGLTAIDIGTTNGGAAFELERRGARRVVAVDIFDSDWFGFAALRDWFGSRVEFVQGSVYELPDLLPETFDIVLMLGVLYHLRHPLLAIDALRQLTRQRLLLETAICDALDSDLRDQPLVRFFRHDELAGDASNWFAPTARTLVDWLESSGFRVARAQTWPPAAPLRALVDCLPHPGPAEFSQISYESPLRVAHRAERTSDGVEAPHG
jgi:tRNA (mo5U34)-methyltransferase